MCPRRWSRRISRSTYPRSTTFRLMSCISSPAVRVHIWYLLVGYILIELRSTSLRWRGSTHKPPRNIIGTIYLLSFKGFLHNIVRWISEGCRLHHVQDFNWNSCCRSYGWTRCHEVSWVGSMQDFCLLIAVREMHVSTFVIPVAFCVFRTIPVAPNSGWVELHHVRFKFSLRERYLLTLS